MKEAWDEKYMHPHAVIGKDKIITYNQDFWYAIGMAQNSPYSVDGDACNNCPMNGPNNINYECCGELDRHMRFSMPLTNGEISALKYFAERYSNEFCQIVIDDLR